MAFLEACHASFTASPSIAGLLMFGPAASAMPQYAIAHLGSSSPARRNEAMASSWLKP